MAVVEDQLQRVMPDRLNGRDADLMLAELQGFLSHAMPTDSRRGGVHPQVLERQLETTAVVERHVEDARLRAKLDGGGVGHVGMMGGRCLVVSG